MLRPRLFVLLLMLGASCSAQLPSERPLGIGPLARHARSPAASGAPVSMPGSAPQMQFDTGDDDDGDEDEATARSDDDSSASSSDAPDPEPGTADAGSSPSTGTSGSAPPAAVVDFSGDYTGKDVSTFRIAGVGDQREEDPNAKLAVKKTGDALTFIIVASNTGDPLCTLKGEQKGDTATLAPGQECTEPQSPFAQGKLTRGQAKLRGKELTLDLSFEVSLNVGGEQLNGSIDYHFEGTRR